MKKLRLVGYLLIGLSALPVAAQLSNVVSGNVVGYYNYPFGPGDNLFANQLAASNHSVALVIPSAPQGTSISIWSSTAGAFTPASRFEAGVWSADLRLTPGQAFRLNTPGPFTNTFIGSVLMPDGSPQFVEWPFPLPPVFGGPDGIYLFACVTPVALSGADVFRYTVGRPPREGEQVMMLDAFTQLYRTTTYSASVWDNGDPYLQVGEAAFFNLGPTGFTLNASMVPEPASLPLAILFAIGLISLRRRLA